ncbi:MAG: saccharopine dehydrogenase NADP-binding domain-containing protein [Desulfobacterales bacterium]|nr:saccharopine dehydrogenase NADP-binding domain-containing protein [Desulfobacterales bacterium]
MKKILVVGAGAQGGPCASILARQEEISEIRLADINLEFTQKVAAKIGGNKVKPIKLDAGNKEALIEAARGVDAVINLTLIDFNDNVIQAAIAAGAHYIDTANAYEYLDEMAKGVSTLKYHEEFNNIGKTALMGCGGTPGLTNVLARYVCDQLDEVDKLYIRIGGTGLGEPDDIVSAWDPGWSPEIALLDFAKKPMIFEDGQYKKVPVFSRPEDYQFDEPVGQNLLASHSHEEPYTLPYFIGKGIKEVDFKYPVDTMAGTFVKMGFADDEEIEVKGVKICPRDVLMKLVHRPANGFLDESEEEINSWEGFSWVMEIEVTGSRNNKKVRHVISQKFHMDKAARLNLFNTFGSSHIDVALPAVAGAKMCLADNTDTGVISSECLDPDSFYNIMTGMGFPVEFEERVESITRYGK